MYTPAPLCKKTLLHTAGFTVLFSLIAHGYRLLNMSFTGDAAQISLTDEAVFQLSIGRFLQPVLWQIRGHITAPLTIGLFAIAALIGAAYLLITMLRIRSSLSIALICGILATNETLGVSYASYLPWCDVYMIAFFFAMCGVYIAARFQHGWLLSPLFYLLSLALYQSYLQTAVALILFLLMLSLFDGERPVRIWQSGVKACAALLAGMGLYYLGVHHIPEWLNVDLMYNYNSARNATVFILEEIPELILSTYLYPFQFFLRPADHAFIPPLLTLAFLLLGMPPLLRRIRRLKLSGFLTLLFLFAVTPLGVNFAAFLAKGIVHPLMTYSFYLLYVFIIALWDHRAADAPDAFRFPALSRALHMGLAALCALMLFLNIKTANQLYLRRDLEFYSTTSAATRILKHADNVDGYIPGETPVCMLGYLPSSSISLVRPGFESLSNLQGMLYTYAASYEMATPWYYQMILGYPVNFVSDEERKAYEASGIGDTMPRYPEEGFCQMIDGVLFVRIH